MKRYIGRSCYAGVLLVFLAFAIVLALFDVSKFLSSERQHGLDVVTSLVRNPDGSRDLTGHILFNGVPVTGAKVIRSRIGDMVRHQFYILFAPLGAMFIYQTLVATETASQGLVVGTAMLAAGVSLNLLLKKAEDGVWRILMN